MHTYSLRNLLLSSLFLVWLTNIGWAQTEPAKVEVTNPSGWLESEDLEFVWREMDKRRMLPGEIEGRIDNSRILYNATFVPFPPDTNHYYTYWGLTEAWFRKYDTDLTEQGYTIFSHSTFNDAGGSLLHNATWVMTGDLLPKDPWEQAVERLESIVDRLLGVFGT